MIDFILLASWSIFCVWIGWRLCVYRTLLALRAIHKAVEENQPHPVHVVIEKKDDIFYIYEKETGAFITQGISSEEIADLLIKKYPGKTFIVDPANLEEVGYLK